MSRIVLVTGASRGIGAATARLAATRGYDVCVNYRQHGDAAREVAADVTALGQRAAVVQADVASEADIVRLFETCDRELGRYKTPKLIRFVTELPRGPSGKVQRLKLLDLVG